MSDKMQSKRPRNTKGGKFAEGRLKLSTSCTECHRRKQRCDHRQPCRNCSRRYPPPQCIYRAFRDKIGDMVSPSGVSHSDKSDESRQEWVEADSNITEEGKEWHLDYTGDITQQSSSYTNENDAFTPKVLSADTLENFDARDYQNLLNSMVTNISSAAFLKADDRDVLFLLPAQSCQPPHSSTPKQSNQRTRAMVLNKKTQSERKVVETPSRFSITVVDPLHFLGITPTVESAELLNAFLKLITRYVVSIDGNPTPNYYNNYWVPWSMKSPLLTYLGIFTAACYQVEARKVKPGYSELVLHYKLKSISLLNKMLNKKETATCNEAITVVMYLVVNEWYWSNFTTVQAHMRGLREMVRLRGGLDQLSMNNFLRNMVLLTDYYMAVSYTQQQYFPHTTTLPTKYPPSMGTPLLRASWDFNMTFEELKINKETARIMGDMQFLFMGILEQVDQESIIQEKKKFLATSAWIRDRIKALPVEVEDDLSFLSPTQIYKSCRLAALIYCKAIVEGVSLAEACTLADLNLLWANMWRVQLSRWKQIPGIFLFIILSAIPAAQNTVHGRFLKSMLKATSSYISLECWDVVDGSLMAVVKLQEWLRNGSLGEAGTSNPASLD